MASSSSTTSNLTEYWPIYNLKRERQLIQGFPRPLLRRGPIQHSTKSGQEDQSTMFAPPAFFPLPPMPERVVRQYVPPPMPTYVDPNAPVLPPPSFSSPEGNYTLIPNMMTNATLLPPPMPIPSGPPATGFGGMSPAMAMAGMGMGGIPPGMFGMGGGPPASASPVAPGGPVAGPAFGQGNGTNGVPNPWPIRANFVTFSINGNGKAGNEGNNQSSGGFGGLLGRGGAKKQEQQQQQAVKKTDNAGSSDEDEDDSAQNKLQYEATYGARGPGGKSRLPPRPKNNLRSTNSSFVTRVSASESFSRLVSNPPHLDPTVYSASHFSNTPPRGSNPPVTHWAFMNTGRTLVWAYVDPTGKQKEPIMRMWFSANITAHAVCETTKVAPGLQGERLDIMVGFATGDLVWVGGCQASEFCWSKVRMADGLVNVFPDPIFGKYTRFSKGVSQYALHPYHKRFQLMNIHLATHCRASFTPSRSPRSAGIPVSRPSSTSSTPMATSSHSALKRKTRLIWSPPSLHPGRPV